MRPWLVLAGVAAPLFPTAAAARGVAFGPNDVRSVVFVAKSENKNEVHYALSLDASCTPTGSTPIRPYWRQREQGEDATEPLLSFEHRAYGVRSQRVEGSRVLAKLAAIERDIVVEAWRGAAGCEARAIMPVAKTPARLHSVYVKLGFPFRVSYLLLQGHALSDGRLVKEKIEG